MRNAVYIRWNSREYLAITWFAARWLLIVTPVAALAGSAVAFFLWLLDIVTATRVAHPALLYGLPLAGVVVAIVYHRFGKAAEGGNNLIVEQIHEPGGGIPWQMAPLVLAGTLVTHLFGGSAGREGTAVQMGGSIAGLFVRWLRLDRDETRILLSCGVAAGFGAVFGTPLTGAIFALEVVSFGRMRYEALLPCFFASIIGDLACTQWGIAHTHYHIAPGAFAGALPIIHLDLLVAAKVAIAAICFGITGFLFAETGHFLSAAFKRLAPSYWIRPIFGGVAVIALVWLVGTPAYLGLGVAPQDPSGISIVNAFHAGGVTPWSWFWKIVFTAVTLAAGFKGGEVTPLFFIGAALGNTLGVLLGLPVDLMAGIGFVAVFAGATNTPIACTVMSVELFGAEYLPYFALGCFIAYLFSGHTGIYLSQRVGASKIAHLPHHTGASLRSIRERGTTRRRDARRAQLGGARGAAGASGAEGAGGSADAAASGDTPGTPPAIGAICFIAGRGGCEGS
jgi:H+/Cl- antiporter ClcA